jgi:hypothetical protein
MRPSVELPPKECRQLLTTKTVGRIAFQTDNGLRVLPVNYVVHEDRIVFRTAPYGIIARSIRAADVAFEVDELDEQLRAGWSVLAIGRCERVEDPAELSAIQQDDAPTPWAEGTRELYFAVRWKGLSGRRLGDA